jgi:hypothetical protein
MEGGIKYEFTAVPWLHEWLFVAMPREMAMEIRDNLRFQEEGWGRMKATAKIGATEWDTAIWFDTKADTYLMPIKSEIRRKEHVEPDKEVYVTIWV